MEKKPPAKKKRKPERTPENKAIEAPENKAPTKRQTFFRFPKP